MTISVTTNRLLKNKFLKKNGKFSSEKYNLASFSQNLELEIPQAINYKGLEGIMIITVETLGSFL